jgi:uncharacterized paraquat-inducible protein A
VSALRRDVDNQWDAPGSVPRLCAGALFMLLLANLFPFIYMKVGGISSEMSCWKSRA